MNIAVPEKVIDLIYELYELVDPDAIETTEMIIELKNKLLKANLIIKELMEYDFGGNFSQYPKEYKDKVRDFIAKCYNQDGIK
jgi:hypothetical protein